MSARIDYIQQTPELFRAYREFSAAVRAGSLGDTLIDLVQIRASQLNGCAFCLDMHVKEAKIHGERAGDKLSAAEVARVLDGARTVMRAALGQGGTSFDALYVNVNGESGYFDRSLQAYGQEGRPCSRCGTPIRRVHFMNRSSFFCPRCQPAPRPRRAPG